MWSLVPPARALQKPGIQARRLDLRQPFFKCVELLAFLLILLRAGDLRVPYTRVYSPSLETASIEAPRLEHCARQTAAPSRTMSRNRDVYRCACAVLRQV